MATRILFFVLLVLGIVHCTLVNLGCKDIKRFVDGHNSRRLQLAKGAVSGQPAATKMNSVVWDEELAQKAREWAKKEQYGHNPDKTLGSKRFGVGENIYMAGTTVKNSQFDVDAALESWFIEHKNYKHTSLKDSDFKRKGNQQIGHYTQMAWSDTVYIGCALARFYDGKYYQSYVVCNYGPAGNYIGNVPFKKAGQLPPSGRLDCGAKDCKKPYGPKC